MASRREPGPWSAGLRAARANLVPGLLIQAAMLALVLAYWWHEPTRDVLDVLARWKARFGYGFSVPLSALAGAVLPEILKVLVFQRGRVRAQNGRTLAFTVPFWGIMGATVDTLYRLQDGWFGSAPTPGVLVTKVFVDQFLYNPLLAAPVTVWAWEWQRRGFVGHGMGHCFTARYYRERVLPTLLATWGVWVPVVTLIYSLPPLLQIPLFSLALSFWALLVAGIAAAEEPAAPATPRFTASA